MKNKRHIALNRTFNLCVFLGPLLLWLAVVLFGDNEKGISIIMGVLGLLALLLSLFLLPCCYLFDKDGVTIRYVLLPSERYLWKNIRAITVTDDGTGPRPHDSLFDLFFSTVFQIRGRVEGKQRFYMEGHIYKSRRTKRLLETHWDGTITGYFGEEVKAWWRRRGKKQRQIAQHLTDQIAPMEREARAKTRAFLAPFQHQAAQQDLELRVEYLYVTEDFDELKSRPAEGYTYTALIEIAHPGETDEARIVCVSTDLLFVRLGKTAWRGVENEKALPELEEMLTETLREIAQNGIESYCK